MRVGDFSHFLSNRDDDDCAVVGRHSNIDVGSIKLLVVEIGDDNAEIFSEHGGAVKPLVGVDNNNVSGVHRHLRINTCSGSTGCQVCKVFIISPPSCLCTASCTRVAARATNS